MIIEFHIVKNENRKPYLIQIWNGKELESEKPAKILANYEVKILQSGNVSIFDITELENGKMLDHDDTLYNNLEELDLSKSQIEFLTGKIIDKVQQMYFDNIRCATLKYEMN